eukprot:scaffold3607_cov114-Isochrysis_galbana.AAC.19
MDELLFMRSDIWLGCQTLRGGRGAPTPTGTRPPECPLYLTGKCENFKIGGVCPFTHTGWDNSMTGR